MTIENIDIDATLERVRNVISEDNELSPAVKSLLEILVLIITLLTNRLGLNSKNSSKPPSTDPNRKKQKKTNSAGKKPGGQQGHAGSTLKRIADPDKIKVLQVDRALLPPGQYKEVGYESRQVFDIDISRVVTEYQAQILEDETGKRFTAPFPPGIKQAAQYGPGLKAHAVYLSQFQLIPYDRVKDYFADQLEIPISTGSLFNFNKEAFNLLTDFEALVKERLTHSPLLHSDETGVNLNGGKAWLHCASNLSWTYLGVHSKRGSEAMNDMGILPNFNGILCHDHWKPYYKYSCSHALCNAHHLRELTRAWEQDGQHWAKLLRELLEEMNKAVNDAGGSLSEDQAKRYRSKYREILTQAEQESPPPDESKRQGKRGRLKRTKSRNLLERLRNYEVDVLRFLENDIVPFTNNLGERDIRMTKVQQKVSGCFRSMEGADIFCRIRSYVSSCRKQDISATAALDLLFHGKYPEWTN